jgi:hypothetical protein
VGFCSGVADPRMGSRGLWVDGPGCWVYFFGFRGPGCPPDDKGLARFPCGRPGRRGRRLSGVSTTPGGRWPRPLTVPVTLPDSAALAVRVT